MSQVFQHSVPNATLVYPTSFPNGGSGPRVCDFDDMVLRLVKWHPSSHGLTSTYSELAASRLGQLIDAPIVRGMEDDYQHIENTASLPAAAVHLAWLQVGDQEGHNQYLYQLEQVLPDKTTRKMNRFILIDQACMCGSHDWSNADLNDPSVPYSLPTHLRSRVTMAQIEPVLERVNTIDEDEIHACFGTFPEGWKITDAHVHKVTGFVIKRRRHLADVLHLSDQPIQLGRPGPASVLLPRRLGRTGSRGPGLTFAFVVMLVVSCCRTASTLPRVTALLVDPAVRTFMTERSSKPVRISFPWL